MKRKVYLLSNAHLDPMWLWDRDEGIAETLSTFRVAADFAEEEDHFVFNHNEAVLYQWVEEYEPELFKRIQRLAEEGKWHIMGGWYLQPDCNMPSGESFVRQIREGRQYFEEKFHQKPTTAINFDPFGHTRGLVQILTKSGYDSYLFMRPHPEFIELPAEDFLWKGFDGSTVMAHRLAEGYNSLKGHASEKLEKMMKDFPDKDPLLVLWGVGNHGGGPSRVDLDMLNECIEKCEDADISHGTPEEYFREIGKRQDTLPVVDYSLQPWAPGCYSSQIRIKQLHRKLENELYLTEKMVTAASLLEGMAYPEKEFKESERDLLFCEFHDILPGSSIQDAEETGMRIMNHGIETLSRIRMKAFIKLCSGQKKGSGSCIPVFVYNPHPYPIEQIVTCEFQLEDQNWGEDFTVPVVYKDGEKVPCQVVKEKSNLNLDWRKQVVFLAKLDPYQMNRFDCNLMRVDAKPAPSQEQENGRYIAGNDELRTAVNAESGMLETYKYNGQEFLNPQAACSLAVIKDDEDPWGMRVTSYQTPCGAFHTMNPEDAADFSGIKGDMLDAVHVIEDGEVEKVTESLMEYGNSRAVVTYHTPKKGGIVHAQVRVFWNEGQKLLKFRIPTVLSDGAFMGQTAFGVDTLKKGGTECVAGKWVGLFDKEKNQAFAVITNGGYGCSCVDGNLEVTLLRSPCYSAHPIMGRPVLAQDRFTAKIDQGERVFDLWFVVGTCDEVTQNIDKLALTRNETPVALSFYPTGDGTKSGELFHISNPAVVMSACYRSGDGVIIRVYNSTEIPQEAEITFPLFGIKETIALNTYEVKTYYAGADGVWEERPLGNE